MTEFSAGEHVLRKVFNKSKNKYDDAEYVILSKFSSERLLKNGTVNKSCTYEITEAGKEKDEIIYGVKIVDGSELRRK